MRGRISLRTHLLGRRRVAVERLLFWVIIVFPLSLLRLILLSGMVVWVAVRTAIILRRRIVSVRRHGPSATTIFSRPTVSCTTSSHPRRSKRWRCLSALRWKLLVARVVSSHHWRAAAMRLRVMHDRRLRRRWKLRFWLVWLIVVCGFVKVLGLLLQRLLSLGRRAVANALVLQPIEVALWVLARMK